MTPLLLALVAGCTQASIKIDATGAGTATDTPSGTLTPPTDDTATPDDTGAPDDTGTTTEEPEPEPDLEAWEGTRHFYVDESDWWGELYCDETVVEHGWPVEDATVLATLEDQCGACTRFYEVEPETTSACDGAFELGSPVYRGVIFEDGAAHVYMFYGPDTYELYATDDEAAWDGWSLDYGYSFTIYVYYVVPVEVEVTGAVSFPEL